MKYNDENSLMKRLFLYIAIQVALLLTLTACASKDFKEAEVSDHKEVKTADYAEVEAVDHETIETIDYKWADEATNSDRRIVCWGDSLTEGTGGDGVTYPKVLEELSGCEVLNYGVYSDNSSLIAARQGGKPSHIENMNEISASVTPAKINIVDDDGTWEMWCNFGDAGINPCRIAGVEGTLSIDTSDGSRYFTRLAPGAAVCVDDGERFYTHAMIDAKPDDILVIWSGSSDRWDEEPDIDAIVRNIDSMLNFSNCEEYVIIGYTVWNGFTDASVPKMWNESLFALWAIRSMILLNL